MTGIGVIPWSIYFSAALFMFDCIGFSNFVATKVQSQNRLYILIIPPLGADKNQDKVVVGESLSALFI